MDQLDKQKQSAIELFNKVLIDTEYAGWTLNFHPESYCWRQKKQIDLCVQPTLESTLQLLLHEVAHILVHPGHGNQHTSEFFKCLEDLVLKYLGTGLCTQEKQFKSFYVSDKD